MIIGPTASGKSALALGWAERHGAEIISADSRQVFRHLDIGTAKPKPEERRRVRHHFVDEREPDRPLTAAEFAAEAEARIESLSAKGTPVVVAGGSTLYLHALHAGLADVPEVPAIVRERLSAELEQRGLPALADELLGADPDLAARTDLHNPRRVLRALEVYRHTGTPLSAFLTKPRRMPRFRYQILLLNWPREVLYKRIESRVDAMMAQGLVEETQQVLGMGFSPTLPALQSIGYAETIAFLHGQTTLPQAVADIQTHTRQYAKRQLTYFNKYFSDALRLDPAQTSPDSAAIDRIFQLL